MGGDERFEAFFAAHYRQLVRALWAYCGDLAVAEDAAQEAFTRTSRDWHRVAEMSSPTGWLHRVAFNEVNGHYRRLEIRSRTLARFGAASAERPVDVAGAVAVREALARLPARQRAALSLFYLADLPIVEVAQAMEVPEGTVKSLLSRGRVALREQLVEPAILKESNDVESS